MLPGQVSRSRSVRYVTGTIRRARLRLHALRVEMVCLTAFLHEFIVSIAPIARGAGRSLRLGFWEPQVFA